MKKLLLIALAAISFGTASAYEHDGEWTWDGEPIVDGQTLSNVYIRNVQTGTFVVRSSFDTKDDDGTTCSVAGNTFNIKYNNEGFPFLSPGYSIYYKPSGMFAREHYLTWAGLTFALEVDGWTPKSLVLGMGQATIHMENTEGNTYKMYYGGLTDAWYLYLTADHKLAKSGSRGAASPYAEWQFISQAEMDAYHVYLKKASAVKDIELYNDQVDKYVAGMSYKTVKVHRNYKAGYSTISLPFAVNEGQFKKVFGNDAYVSAFTSVDENNGIYTLRFTKGKSMKANTPYLLYLPAALENPVTFENVTVITEISLPVPDVSSLEDSDAELAKYKGWTMHSNYEIELSMENKYGVVNSEKKIMRGSSTSYAKGFTGYFTFGGPANSVQAIFVDGQGELTDIQQLEPVGTENGQTIYTISGQRVNNAVNGINIINGRKVLKK